MAEHQRNYYAIIPANVRYDQDLTANAKLLYGEITALCNERGYCWASNSYFAELYKVSKNTASRWIQQLIEKGYIESEMHYKEGSKEVESRILTIATPIHKNGYTPPQKRGGGTHKNEDTPPLKNGEDNNTAINITNNISTTDRAREIFDAVQQNIRFNLSPIEQETIDYWLKDYPHELILEAIKRAALSNKTTLRYVESILKDWQKKRITTLEEVERDDAAFNQKKGGKANGSIPRQQGSSRVDAEERLRQQTERLKDFL